ncbi:MAG: GAF domain-containing protein [Pseudomonadota bacterium]|nr:GAF domain-containing protein [Pseudomonadota bacterium]
MEECEKELLHLTGEIQSFGAFLRVEQATLSVTHVSQNIHEFIDATASELLGETLDNLYWFPADAITELGQYTGNRLTVSVNGKSDRLLSAQVIRCEGGFHLELEESRYGVCGYLSQDPGADVIKLFKEDCQETEYFNRFVAIIGDALPFERTMLYRFQADWGGEVVAEYCKTEKPCYLGLKFPASDIPEIARRLYFENSSRLIADASYEPVSIVSVSNNPPDLTHSDLRSVSPVHLRYLTNMGVKSSFSIALILGGQLWGIVSCHHPLTVKLASEQRRSAEQAVKTFCTAYSGYLAGKRLSWLKAADARLANLRLTLLSTEKHNYSHVLTESVYNLFDCEGVFVSLAKQVSWFGPDEDRTWLRGLEQCVSSLTGQHVFSTDDIRSHSFLDSSASWPFRGALVMKEKYERDSLRIVVLRKPEKQTTSWAGNPDKSLLKRDESGVLTPRASFQKWSETSGERSIPWQQQDILLARKLRAMLITLSKTVSRLESGRL